MSRKWYKDILTWTEGDEAMISVVFSWQLQEAYQCAIRYKSEGFKVLVGGPAAYMNPSLFNGIATIVEGEDIIWWYNPEATFTSRGCVRKCPFCIVPKIEGDLVELKDWPVRPVVCDNNLLACSQTHFDRVIDKLKPLHGVDFNQGLDARLMTDHHVDRLRELDLYRVRLAWDFTKMEKHFMAAYERLRKVGIPKSRISVYVLIGFGDTPTDALYRLQTVRELGVYSNPMRYQPIDTPKRNSYVHPNWTNGELIRYMRYWANLRWTAGVPFDEFEYPSPPKDLRIKSTRRTNANT